MAAFSHLTVTEQSHIVYPSLNPTIKKDDA